jgi:hypothetical protein
VPPGVIVLLIGALGVVLLPWRWTPLWGVVNALAILIGAFTITGETFQRLTTPGEIGAFLGTVAQMGGVAVVILSGVAAVLATPGDTVRAAADTRADAGSAPRNPVS